MAFRGSESDDVVEHSDPDGAHSRQDVTASTGSFGSRLARTLLGASAGLTGHIVRALAYGLSGGIITLVIVLVIHLERRSALEVWHEVRLEEEFTRSSGISTFTEYLELEERLFEEVDQKVYAAIDTEDQTRINRYNRGSLADPGRWPRNWNRSYEVPAENPRAGVVLLHGMSDSPYSLRAMAERLTEEGVWVVGIRLPGHGTVPAGLTDVRWEDLAAASSIAVRRARAKVGDRPVYIVGYSTGGTLAVHYALRSLRDEERPHVDGLVLISPAMGVSPVAAFAVWQSRLGRLLRMDKLAWNDLSPEYDPFKYGSFAVNGGDVVYRLSNAVQTEFDRTSDDLLRELPPIIAFQSAVDATVVTGAVLDELFDRLPDNGSELILFDINRSAEVEAVLSEDPATFLAGLLEGEPRNYSAAVLTNESDGVEVVALHVRKANGEDVETVPLEMTWPEGVYSLSHVSLPTPYDDPLYGGDPDVESPSLRLGQVALRGERGVLRIHASTMLRLQWNPFYPWMEERALEFMGLGADDESSEPTDR